MLPLLTSSPISTIQPISTTSLISNSENAIVRCIVAVVRLIRRCITWWFQNADYSPMAQLIVAFIYGVLLSPWGSGLFWLLTFILLYEIAFYIFTHGHPTYWQHRTRAGIIICSILGWIIGRTVASSDILVEGVPNIPFASKSNKNIFTNSMTSNKNKVSSTSDNKVLPKFPETFLPYSNSSNDSNQKSRDESNIDTNSRSSSKYRGTNYNVIMTHRRKEDNADNHGNDEEQQKENDV
jgi:hypothetical protein